MPSGFFTGQIGAIIKLDTQDDAGLLASATTKEIYCKIPHSGGTVTWTASVEGTKLTYTTTSADDLPTDGEYELQAHLEGTGFSLSGEISTMTVYAPLK